ncbi:MAG: hypothetical protein L7F77_02400, partial [Candidatus Magnetominusculus sp. LBB02]|nr:hypothetical protein [Candidatus Magnetominusculus sp. LBB02]
MTESINRPYEPRLKIIVCLTLIVIVFSVFLQVKSFNFVYYDDDQYILTNLHVRGGFSISNLEWALTSNEYSNWFPLTWVSHMADVWLYGLWPGGHHLTNVCLHAVNTVLLFLFFSSVTGTIWRSALIAALFAAHPMRVESVAWVAERKDVLSAFFWISAMCAYVYYTKRPSLGRYMSVILCFILGLMSKPVIITLPLALLLADYWPLGRFTSRAGAASLLMEKVPFLILSAISGVITFSVQQAGGSVAPLSSLTLALRLE